MMIPDYEKLWHPYAKSGCSLDRAITWAKKQSGASDEIISTAVKNLFLELAQGREFSIKGCDCGCEMKNTHTAINHYFLKEVLKLKQHMDKEYWQLLQEMQKADICKHIQIENRKYRKSKLIPWYDKIFNPQFVELLRKIGLVRGSKHRDISDPNAH